MATEVLKQMVLAMGQKARAASRSLAKVSTTVKNEALRAMAAGLLEHAEDILEANRRDCAAAREKGLSAAMVDRLTLNQQRLKAMADGILEIATLHDPVGEVPKMWRRPNGLLIGKVRVPLGVIGVIYESRPNVTADTAALCLKSGNAVILRGGSEAFHSNRAITRILSDAASGHGIPAGALQLVETTDRDAVHELLQMDRHLDVIIPRGGPDLISLVTEHSRVPIIKHDKGLCHTYVDAHADLEMALRVCTNAKIQRPGVCNAMETLLVHQSVASYFLPQLSEIFSPAGVEIRGCPRTQAILPGARAAQDQDWDEEYLDLILAVKVVDNIEEALAHIERHGSGLAEAIITSDYTNSRRFLDEVDAAAVFVNASTRFTDGNQFGLGAEMGISTQKLHVRGPMGLEDLTCTKYIIQGSGQIRE